MNIAERFNVSVLEGKRPVTYKGSVIKVLVD